MKQVYLTFTNLHSLLKIYHSKHNPKTIRYKTYNYFNNEIFRKDVLRDLSFENVRLNVFGKLRIITSNLLSSHAPLKEKHIRCNQAAFMTKDSSKTI